MLYQLFVYAVSHRDQPRSTIFYPTFHPGVRETRIEVMDSHYGNVIGEVRLCPVNLEQLEILVSDLTEEGRREREAYAFKLSE